MREPQVLQIVNHHGSGHVVALAAGPVSLAAFALEPKAVLHPGDVEGLHVILRPDVQLAGLNGLRGVEVGDRAAVRGAADDLLRPDRLHEGVHLARSRTLEDLVGAHMFPPFDSLPELLLGRDNTLPLSMEEPVEAAPLPAEARDGGRSALVGHSGGRRAHWTEEVGEPLPQLSCSRTVGGAARARARGLGTMRFSVRNWKQGRRRFGGRQHAILNEATEEARAVALP
mmetsp:Transcript_47579/g.132289  ORF Transcript_47579/g.132289 Transcript_47579/m.132289 type:complete len:228 (+) Transcript_47579:433-1116(+)